MHYTFKSKADADLLMLGPVGDQLLRIVGKEPARQGIIEAAAIPAAIGAIEAAIAAEDKAGRGVADDDDVLPGAQPVTLKQRAWPMLEMMKHSLSEKADIVWGV
jgi:hypothetical protein